MKEVVIAYQQLQKNQSGAIDKSGGENRIISS